MSCNSTGTIMKKPTNQSDLPDLLAEMYNGPHDGKIVGVMLGWKETSVEGEIYERFDAINRSGFVIFFHKKSLTDS